MGARRTERRLLGGVTHVSREGTGPRVGSPVQPARPSVTLWRERSGGVRALLPRGQTSEKMHTFLDPRGVGPGRFPPRGHQGRGWTGHGIWDCARVHASGIYKSSTAVLSLVATLRGDKSDGPGGGRAAPGRDGPASRAPAKRLVRPRHARSAHQGGAPRGAPGQAPHRAAVQPYQQHQVQPDHVHPRQHCGAVRAVHEPLLSSDSMPAGLPVAPWLCRPPAAPASLLAANGPQASMAASCRYCNSIAVAHCPCLVPETASHSVFRS